VTLPHPFKLGQETELSSLSNKIMYESLVMEPVVQVTTKRVNRWNYNYISPGPVASIGDPIQDIKLYSSCPDDPIRWKYSARQLQRMGSAVTDGSVMNPFNRGLGATTIINDPYSDDITAYEEGFVLQEVRPNDLAADVRQKPDPQQGWKALTSQSDWSPFSNYTGPVVQSGTISRGNEPQTTIAVPAVQGVGSPDNLLNPQGGISAPRASNGPITLGMGIPTGTGGGIGPGTVSQGGSGLAPSAVGGAGQCIRPY